MIRSILTKLKMRLRGEIPTETYVKNCIVHGGMNEYLVAWGNREKINRAIE